jgi:hypothetical protein
MTERGPLSHDDNFEHQVRGRRTVSNKYIISLVLTLIVIICLFCTLCAKYRDHDGPHWCLGLPHHNQCSDNPFRSWWCGACMRSAQHTERYMGRVNQRPVGVWFRPASTTAYPEH